MPQKEVSKVGRKQHTRETPGRAFHKRKGYWLVNWRQDGKNKQMLEHRWVWEQAYGPIPKGYEIHHVDHNKLNNDISNLQCMTRKAHRQHHAEHDGKQTYQSAEAARAAKEEYDREYQRKHRAVNRDAYNEYMREYRCKKKLAAAGLTK